MNGENRKDQDRLVFFFEYVFLCLFNYSSMIILPDGNDILNINVIIVLWH
jgi:hypothetical protein